MFYLKIFGLMVWLLISCIWGLGLCVFRRDLNLNRDFARFFSWGALKISGINVNIEGRENLSEDRPCIYVVNHQSGLDMAIFGLIYPSKTVLIGKKEVAVIPVFGWFYKLAGNIMIDRKKTTEAKDILAQTVKEHVEKDAVSVWIFPEGTRNASGIGLLPFKKGAFHMAISAQVPVVPLISTSLAGIANWEKKKFPGGNVTVKVLPPIETKGMNLENIEELKNKTESLMSRELEIISPKVQHLSSRI